MNSRFRFFIKLDFSPDPAYIWTGSGEIEFNQNTYFGVGDMGDISQVQESTTLQANGLDLTLFGWPSNYINHALNADYSGKSALIWCGYLNSDLKTFSKSPRLWFRGRMDKMVVIDSSEHSTIEVSCEQGAIDFNRARLQMWSHEDQLHKNKPIVDLGCQYIEQTAGKEIKWGR